MGVTNMVEKDIIETKISEGKKYGWKNDRRFIQRL